MNGSTAVLSDWLLLRCKGRCHSHAESAFVASHTLKSNRPETSTVTPGGRRKLSGRPIVDSSVRRFCRMRGSPYSATIPEGSYLEKSPRLDHELRLSTGSSSHSSPPCLTETHWESQSHAGLVAPIPRRDHEAVVEEEGTLSAARLRSFLTVPMTSRPISFEPR